VLLFPLRRSIKGDIMRKNKCYWLEDDDKCSLKGRYNHIKCEDCVDFEEDK